MGANQFQIKLWGVRGSIPRPEIPQALFQRFAQVIHDFAASGKTPKDFIEQMNLALIGGYGGNTTCVEVSQGDRRLIIDAGSGIRELGIRLMQGPLGQGKGEAHIDRKSVV